MHFAKFKDEWEYDEVDEDDIEEEGVQAAGGGDELRLRVQNHLLRWYYTNV